MRHIPLNVHVILDTERHAIEEPQLATLGVPLSRGPRGGERALLLTVAVDPGVGVLALRAATSLDALEESLGDLEGRDGLGFVGGVVVCG